MLSERRALDKALFLEWVGEIQRVEFADVTGPGLDRHKIKTARKFDEVRRFITWFATAYGSYGTRMHPLKVTASEDYGSVSASVIGRWLQAATSMGWLEMTVAPDSRRGLAAEFQVAPFWLGRSANPFTEEPPY